MNSKKALNNLVWRLNRAIVWAQEFPGSPNSWTWLDQVAKELQKEIDDLNVVVKVEVVGGVAYPEDDVPDWIIVDVIDHDNDEMENEDE